MSQQEMCLVKNIKNSTNSKTTAGKLCEYQYCYNAGLTAVHDVMCNSVKQQVNSRDVNNDNVCRSKQE